MQLKQGLAIGLFFCGCTLISTCKKASVSPAPQTESSTQVLQNEPPPLKKETASSSVASAAHTEECIRYAKAYQQALSVNPLGSDKLAAVGEAIYKICRVTLAEGNKQAPAPTHGQPSSSASTSTGAGAKSSDANPGLGLFSGTPAPTVELPSGFSSILTAALVPLLGDEGARTVAEGLDVLTEGWGVGAGITGGVAGPLGIGVQGGLAIELMYNRQPGLSGPGVISFFCAPSLGLGVGQGATGSAGVYFFKALGCTDSSRYEGGFLTFPVTLGNSSIAPALGVDAGKLMAFHSFLLKASWINSFTPQQIDREMAEFDKFLNASLKTAVSPLELVALLLHLIVVNAALSESNIVQALAGDPARHAEALAWNSFKRISLGLPEKILSITGSLLRQIINLDLIKTKNYSSFKFAFIKLRDKLAPQENFLFNRVVLDKLIDALAGCDGISFSPSFASISKLTGKGFGIGATYAYYVNPEYLGVGVGPGDPSWDVKKKTRLDLASFADFVDPRAWEAAGSTLIGNTVKGVEQVVDTVKGVFSLSSGEERLPCAHWNLRRLKSGKMALACSSFPFSLLEFESASVLDMGKIGEFTGLNQFGPPNFVLRMSNVANPLYLSKHCLEPSLGNVAELGSQVGKLFSFSLD